jgi:hypothetical protein
MFDKALIALDLSPAELPLLDCLPAWILILGDRRTLSRVPTVRNRP